jgi:TetR/AcrR family transcriptional regulator, tetracycline repressor protein
MSMRQLGAALDVEAMSIYKHLPDREAVIDSAVATLYGEISLPAPSVGWKDATRALAHELRRVVLDHPNLGARALTRPPACLEVQRPADRILGALRTAAPDDQTAVRWFWMFVNYTTGALISELTAFRTPPPTPTVRPDRTTGTDLGAATIECPALAALGPELAGCDFAAEFEFGLGTLLGAFDRAKRRRRRGG